MGDSQSVIFVDDEENVLNALKRTLRKEPYETHFFSAGAEALEFLKTNPVNLIVCDHKMPEITGISLLHQAKEIQPDAVRVILSGYAEIHVVVDAINTGEVYRFLSKPWQDEDLKMNITNCLKQYDLSVANKSLAQELNEKNQQLKTLVEERTSLLDNTQQIINALPYPIIGVDSQNEITLVNEAYNRFTQGQGFMHMGVDLSDIFPECINCYPFGDSTRKASMVSATFSEKSVNLWVTPLVSQQHDRGNVITIMDIHYE